MTKRDTERAKDSLVKLRVPATMAEVCEAVFPKQIAPHNLPVPVLAEPHRARGSESSQLCGEARESTHRMIAGDDLKGVMTADSRGGQSSLPPGWPTLQEQREYWLRKEQEWVGCNGGENDHLFTTNEDEYYEQD